MKHLFRIAWLALAVLCLTSVALAAEVNGLTILYEEIPELQTDDWDSPAEANDGDVQRIDRVVTPRLIPGKEITKVYDKTVNCVDSPTSTGLRGSDFMFFDSDGNDVTGEMRVSRLTAQYETRDVGDVDVLVNLEITSNSDQYHYILGESQYRFPGKITPKALIIMPWAGQSKQYGANDPVLKGTVSGLYQGDTINGALSREPGEDVGWYRIMAGTLSAGSNYNVDVQEVYFEIVLKPINSPDIACASIANQLYTGQPIVPPVILRYRDATLVQGTDFSAAYANNINIGTATVTVTGMGNFTGTRTIAFTILKPDVAAIDAANFPDETFRAYVAQEIDRDGNGSLSQDEIDMTTYIDVTGRGIRSLEGIQLFSSLSRLFCEGNPLKTLDVSHNARLETLQCIDCQLTTLKLSGCDHLKKLFCGENPLKTLDLTHCPRLEFVNCVSCQLTSLDVSKNSRLEELHCQENRLRTLDISNNPRMNRVFCQSNPLSMVDVSQCPDISMYVNDQYYHEHGDSVFYGVFYEEYDDLMKYGIEFDRNVKIKGDESSQSGDIIIDPVPDPIAVKQSVQLTAALIDTGAAVKKVKWSTSNKKIVSVSSKGKITGKAAGAATVTATAPDGHTASIEVEVYDASLPESLSFSEAAAALTVKQRFNAAELLVIAPDSAKPKLKWRSDNKKIATVTGKGVVTGKAAGTTAIIVAAGSLEARLEVAVKDPAGVTDATIVCPGEPTVPVKGKLTLSVNYTPEGAAPKKVKWTSSNKKVAAVSNKGVVTGKKAGDVTITLTAGNVSDSIQITVTDPDAPEKLWFAEDTPTSVALKKSIDLSGYLMKEPAAAKAKLKWTTSNKKIAAVSGKGKVTGKGVGTATITAAAPNGIAAAIEITVE